MRCRSFSARAIEALRRPLEEGSVTIVRGQRAVVFPTRFMLVAATNPCPCGYAGEGDRCTCTDVDHRRHERRLSGPLLDRMDLMVECLASVRGRDASGAGDRFGEGRVTGSRRRASVNDIAWRGRRRAVTGNSTLA